MKANTMKASIALVVLALVSLLPVQAFACGYSQLTCGFADRVEQVRTNDGAVEYKIYGSFAWGSPWGWDSSDNYGVIGKSEAMLHLRCEADDTWCLEQLPGILDAEGTNTALVIWDYEYWGDEKPGYLSEDGGEEYIMEVWNFPQTTDYMADSYICRSAAQLQRRNDLSELHAATELVAAVNTGSAEFGIEKSLSQRKVALEEGVSHSAENSEIFLAELEAAFGDERLSVLEGELLRNLEAQTQETEELNEDGEVQAAGCSTSASPMGTAVWAGLLLGGLLFARRNFHGVTTKPCA